MDLRFSLGFPMEPQRGLIVRPPGAQALVEGKTQWELRRTPTEVRGLTAVLEAGSGRVLGTVEFVDFLGPLGPDDLREAARQGLISEQDIHAADSVAQYAWVAAHPRALAEPAHYRQPRGGVVWVGLSAETKAALALNAPAETVRKTGPCP